MTVTLKQLTLAELRDLCRQHGLPQSHNAERMREEIRNAHKTGTLTGTGQQHLTLSP